MQLEVKCARGREARKMSGGAEGAKEDEKEKFPRMQRSFEPRKQQVEANQLLSLHNEDDADENQ